MLERYGNIWSVLDATPYGDGHTKHILVTTNNCVKSNDCLVMGAGSALDAATRFPNMPEVFGKMVKTLGYRYGLLFDPQHILGGFQTKYHFMDKSTVELIKHSTDKLTEQALAFPDIEFHLCYPGIGFGRLTMDVVKPVIETMPDNVFVWMKQPK